MSLKQHYIERGSVYDACEKLRALCTRGKFQFQFQAKRKEKHLLRRAPSKSQSYTIKNAHIQNEFSALFSGVMYCSSH